MRYCSKCRRMVLSAVFLCPLWIWTAYTTAAWSYHTQDNPSVISSSMFRTQQSLVVLEHWGTSYDTRYCWGLSYSTNSLAVPLFPTIIPTCHTPKYQNIKYLSYGGKKIKVSSPNLAACHPYVRYCCCLRASACEKLPSCLWYHCTATSRSIMCVCVSRELENLAGLTLAVGR